MPTPPLDRALRAEAAKFLAELEVLDCDCWEEQPCLCLEYQHNGACTCPRYPYPCLHVLAISHDLPFEEWSALLLSAGPAAYQEPPPPQSPAKCLTREARVALLAQRRALGFGLWHSSDWLSKSGMAAYGPLAARTNNGRMLRGLGIVDDGRLRIYQAKRKPQ